MPPNSPTPGDWIYLIPMIAIGLVILHSSRARRRMTAKAAGALDAPKVAALNGGRSHTLVLAGDPRNRANLGRPQSPPAC